MFLNWDCSHYHTGRICIEHWLLRVEKRAFLRTLIATSHMISDQVEAVVGVP